MAYNNTDLSQEKDVQANEHPKESSMAFYKVMQRYIPIVIINLLIIIIMSYLISPLSKVATIVVKGNEAVYDQQIIEESGIRSKDSVLELMRKKDTTAENIVQNLPQVSESSVDISGFNEVIIQVKEYNTVAYIAKEQSYLRVLENGTVLDEEYNVSIGNQPVLTKFEEGAALDRMNEELSKVDMPILNLISEIELVTDRENSLFIRVYKNNGNRVLSLIPTFSEKIPYYPQMVKAVNGKKGVFDM